MSFSLKPKGDSDSKKSWVKSRSITFFFLFDRNYYIRNYKYHYTVKSNNITDLALFSN